MPIRPFLAGQPFDPDAINNMSCALESVCEELGLRSIIDDAATRIVARRVIEYAQRGVRDADTLRAMVLKEFKVDDQKFQKL